MTVTAGLERTLSQAEAAELLGVSERTVRRLVFRGELPVIRIGGRRLIDPADLRAFRDARRTEAGP